MADEKESKEVGTVHPIEVCRHSTVSPLCFVDLVKTYLMPGVLYFVDMMNDAPMAPVRLTNVEDGSWVILSWAEQHNKMDIDFRLYRHLPRHHVRLRADDTLFYNIVLDDDEVLDIMCQPKRDMGIVFEVDNGDPRHFGYYFRTLPVDFLRDLRAQQYWSIATKDSTFWDNLITQGYRFALEQSCGC